MEVKTSSPSKTLGLVGVIGLGFLENTKQKI